MTGRPRGRFKPNSAVDRSGAVQALEPGARRDAFTAPRFPVFFTTDSTDEGDG